MPRNKIGISFLAEPINRFTKPKRGGTLTATANRNLGPREVLANIGDGRKSVAFSEKQIIFKQGDAADAIFYIQEGKVRLTVLSRSGKEASLGILSAGEFFGEGCLTAQSLRIGSAIAMTNCRLLQIEKRAMMLALKQEHKLSDQFVTYLLARHTRCEEDLIDHLSNSSEKRLARTLLLLAHFGEEGAPEVVITNVTQETLAAMVGTTRSRVNVFMNRFRKLGFIEYGAEGIRIHSALLSTLLHD
jgi:CRP/FNR family cyclic AMP-dependent transcriptional regulator